MAATAIKTIKWPRILTTTHLTNLIKEQKNPLTALDLFTLAPLLYPTTYKHNSSVYSALLLSLSSSPLHLSHITPSLLSSLPSRASPLFSRVLLSLPPSLSLSLFRQLPFHPLLFHSLISNLISHHDFQSVCQLFDEILQSNPKIRIETFNLILRTLVNIGQVDFAVHIFTEIHSHCCYPDRDTYRILMRGLCGGDRLDDGIHLIYSMLWRISRKGCESDVVVYRMLLEKLVESGRVKDAETVLGKVLLKGLRSPGKRRGFVNVQLEGLEVEAMKRRIDAALVVGGVRSLKSYEAVVGDLYEEGKFADADKIMGEMVGKGFRPSVSVFEKKIEALCGVRRVDDAVGILEKDVKENGCVPNTKMHNLVMRGFCEEKKGMKAVEVLVGMEKKVGCVANKESYETVIGGLLREGEYMEAEKVMEMMARKRFWADGEMYCEVIKGLCRVGRRYGAVMWLEEMVSQAKFPDVLVWMELVEIVVDCECLGDVLELGMIAYD